MKTAIYDNSTIDLITKITGIGIKDGLAGSIASLSMVMNQFEQFKKDFPFLWSYKIITADNNSNFKWNYSTTSLAEYFKSLSEDKKKYTNKREFFWENIEKAFSYKKGVLRQYAYNAKDYGNSKDYIKLKEIFECKKDISELEGKLGEKLAYLEKLTNLENL